jgi:hypothetical protein
MAFRKSGFQNSYAAPNDMAFRCSCGRGYQSLSRKSQCVVWPPVAAACAVISRSLGCAPPSSAIGSARWRQPPGGSAASMAQTVQLLAVATGAAASCCADVQGLARVAGAQHRPAVRPAPAPVGRLSTFHAPNVIKTTAHDPPSMTCHRGLVWGFLHAAWVRFRVVEGPKISY